MVIRVSLFVFPASKLIRDGDINTLCNMRTVMIRFHTSGRIRRVDMKGMEMCADLLHRREILDHAGAGLKHTAFGRSRTPGGSIIVDGEVLGIHFLRL